MIYFSRLVFILLRSTLLLMATLHAAETTPLRIQVKSDAGSVVVGARVFLNGLVIALTGADGVAHTALPPGKAQLTVSKVGFAPVATSLLVEEGRQQRLVVELTPLGEVKEVITVSATRTDTRLQDSPTRVEVLGRDEIEEKMLMTPGDISMMLNEMGGMRVQTTSPSLGAASVRIQGMRGRYTRFLSDGLPLFGQQGDGLGILQTPPTDLEQVEVIKGAASALYGAGAMAGVVNLISRRPKDEPVHEFLFNRSTLGATDISGFVASKFSPRWGVSLLGIGDWQSRKDKDADGWADLAGYSRGVMRPRLFWNGAQHQTASLTGGVTYENRMGGTMPGSVLAATGAPYVEALNTRRYDFGGNFQSLIDNRIVVTARVAASEAQYNHRFGEVVERESHSMLFGEVAGRGTVGRQTWVIGAAAEREAFQPRDVPRFAYQYTTPGVFLQDDILVAPWLSLSASARMDFHSRYGAFFSPRLSGLWRWHGWTSRASGGQSFFAPRPLTEETGAAGLFRLNAPSPLVAERGRSGSIDIGRTVGPVSASATFFGSTVRNPIHVSRDSRYEITNSVAPVRNKGLELLSTLRKARVSATASYTYVRARETEVDKVMDAPLTPHHSFGVTGVWEKENSGRIGLEFYYTGQQRLEQNPYRTNSKAYISVGFLVERKLGPIRVFLNAENLNDARQTRWNSLLRPDRAVDGRWTVDAWAPLDGRVFNGGVRWRF